MYPQKVPRKVILLLFFGVWSQRRSRMVPKTPPEHPTRSNLVEKLTKSCARNWISVMFYWVLSQTEPTCPQVLSRCFQMFPDASRVLIRVSCKELPRRRQEKQTKTKYTLSILWDSDSVGKEALRFQQASPRLGGKT